MKKTLFLTAILGAAVAYTMGSAAYAGYYGNTFYMNGNNETDFNQTGLTGITPVQDTTTGLWSNGYGTMTAATTAAGGKYILNTDVDGAAVINNISTGEITAATIEELNIAGGTTKNITAGGNGVFKGTGLVIEELNVSGDTASTLNVNSGHLVTLQSVGSGNLNITNAGTLTLGTDSTTNSFGTISNTGSLTLAGTVNVTSTLTTDTAVAVNGTLNLTDATLNFKGSYDGESTVTHDATTTGVATYEATYTLFTGDGTISGLTTSNLQLNGTTVTGGTLSADSKTYTATIGNEYYVKTSIRLSAIQNETSTFNRVYVATDGTVMATGNTYNGAIVLNGGTIGQDGTSAVTYGNVTVIGDSMISANSTDGAVITTLNLQGGTLSTTGNGSVKAGQINVTADSAVGTITDQNMDVKSGTLTINGTFTLNGQIDMRGSGAAYTGMIKVASSGILNLQNHWLWGKNSYESLFMDKGGQIISNNFTMTGLEAGGSIKTNDNIFSLTNTSTVIKNAAITYSSTSTGTISAQLNGSTLAVADGVTTTLSYNGTKLTDSTITGVTLGGAERVTFSGNVVAKDIVNGLTSSSNGYAFLGAGSSTLTLQGTIDLSKKSDGTATTHGKIGLNSSDKAVIDDNASVTVIGFYASSTNSNNGAVTVNSGATLTITGTQNTISTLTNDGTVNFTGWEGTAAARTENGYNSYTATHTFTSDAGNYIGSFAGSGTYQLNGHDATRTDNTLTATYTGDVYYVDKANATYDSTVTSYEVASGYSLSITLGDTTSEIDKILASSTGTVILSGGTHATQLPADSAHLANVTLNLNGLSCWMTAGSTISKNLTLTNPDTEIPGFTHTDQWGSNTNAAVLASLAINGANEGYTYTFAGAISGSGNMAYAQTNNRTTTYKLTGDISNWTGSFITCNTGTTTVDFGTATTAIQAGVTNSAADTTTDNASKLKVQFNKTESDITMSGNVTKSANNQLELNLADDANVTFSGTVSDGVDLTLGSGATAAFTGVTALSLNNLTLNGGTVTLDHENTMLTTSALSLTGKSTINSNVKLTSGATVTVAKGAELNLGCTLTLDGAASFTLSEQVTDAPITFTTVMTGVEGINADADGWTLATGTKDTYYKYLTEATTDGSTYTYSTTNTATNRMLVYYGSGENAYKLMVTPEPATATLSLLALAGLCARRRRH